MHIFSLIWDLNLKPVRRVDQTQDRQIKCDFFFQSRITSQNVSVTRIVLLVAKSLAFILALKCMNVIFLGNMSICYVPDYTLKVKELK